MTENYENLNPQQLVPALVIDGNTLTQSLSIMEYLEETRPENPILPAKAYDRAQVRKIALSIAAEIQPIQNLKVLKYVGDEKKMEWGKHWIEKGFVALEKILEKTAGEYCYGNSITIADFCLVPQVYNATRFSVDLNQFPIISRINQTLSKLPQFEKAHPNNQIDAVL